MISENEDDRANTSEHILWSAYSRKTQHTLLVLHDLGQHERSLLRVMKPFSKDYNVLSLKGGVGTGSQWGYFSPGDDPRQLRKELRSRTQDFHSMLMKLLNYYEIDKQKIVGLGYKHGANFLAALILCYPELFEGAVLIRPYLSINPNGDNTVLDLPILITGSKMQVSDSSMNTIHIMQMLIKKGATIDMNFLPVSSRITIFDQNLIQQFIHNNF